MKLKRIKKVLAMKEPADLLFEAFEYAGKLLGDSDTNPSAYGHNLGQTIINVLKGAQQSEMSDDEAYDKFKEFVKGFMKGMQK